MTEKKAVAAHDLVVLARAGHGQDYKEIFHANRAADSKGVMVLGTGATLEESKALCIAVIREHRAVGAGMDYRISDKVTGKEID